MTKAEIIDKLMIKHNIGLTGYTRGQLEALPEGELEEWLKELDEDLSEEASLMTERKEDGV